MLLSIIIPVFNVEKYIIACIDSIINQLHNEVEVIVVDDGSTDTSFNLLNNHIQQQNQNISSHFLILKQKNQGVSKARNFGLEHARGMYVSFLDSDDLLHQDYIPTILNIITDKEPDIIQFNFNYISNNLDITNKSKLDYSFTVGFQDINHSILINLFNDNVWFSWLRIYKKSFFNQWYFPEHMSYFEDARILPYILIKAKTIYLLNTSLYQYRQCPTSATKDLSPIKLEKLLTNAEIIIEVLMSSTKENPLFGIILIHFFKIYIDYSRKNLNSIRTRENWNKFSKAIHKLNINPNIIKDPQARLLIYFINYGILGFYLARFFSKFLRQIQKINNKSNG